MPNQVKHGEIRIQALDELAGQPYRRKSGYTEEMDAALMEYGSKVQGSQLSWTAIAAAFNKQFGVQKSRAAWEKRYRRLREATEVIGP